MVFVKKRLTIKLLSEQVKQVVKPVVKSSNTEDK